MLPHVRDVRRAGSAALDLCAVAAGWVDAYLEHGCNWWDWAAAALIAAEAGAVVRVPGPTGTSRRTTGWAPTPCSPPRPASPRSSPRWPASTARPRSELAEPRRAQQAARRGPRASSAAGPTAGAGGAGVGAFGSALAAPSGPAGRRRRAGRARRGPRRTGLRSPNAVPTDDVDGVVGAAVAHQLGAGQHQRERCSPPASPAGAEPQLAGALHVAVGVERVVVRRRRLGEAEVAELRGHQVGLAALPAAR